MRRRLLDAHPGDRSRDDQLLNLTRAFEDRVDLRDFAKGPMNQRLFQDLSGHAVTKSVYPPGGASAPPLLSGNIWARAAATVTNPRYTRERFAHHSRCETRRPVHIQLQLLGPIHHSVRRRPNFPQNDRNLGRLPLPSLACIPESPVGQTVADSLRHSRLWTAARPRGSTPSEHVPPRTAGGSHL